MYVNTIFVPDLEPTSFVSMCDIMYFILFFIIIFYFFVESMYVFILTCSVSNIQLFHGFMECLNTIQGASRCVHRKNTVTDHLYTILARFACSSSPS
jgi:hypothetical protein